MAAVTPLPSLCAYRPRAFEDLVRRGSDADGGYVLPQRLISVSQSLLSLGVYDDWSFEEALLRDRPDLAVTCVDGTTSPEIIAARVHREMRKALRRLRIGKFIRMAKLRSRPQEFREFFARHEFINRLVGARGGGAYVTLPELLEHVRGGQAQRWVLVKMDIEGSEYEVLESACRQLEFVSGLLIEFHELDRHWRRFERVMGLLAPHFHIAHVHGNNNTGYVPGTLVPLTPEITLINKSLCAADAPESSASYPLAGLDRPNQPRRKDMTLSFQRGAEAR